MAEFTAKDVQALRQATGAGMMDAKKALTENDGDMEAAAQWLREKGLAKVGQARATARTPRASVSAVGRRPGRRHRRAQVRDRLLGQVRRLHLARAGPRRRSWSPRATDAVAELADEHRRPEDHPEGEHRGRPRRPLRGRRRQRPRHLPPPARTAAASTPCSSSSTAARTELAHDIAVHIAFAKPPYLHRDEVPADDVERGAPGAARASPRPRASPSRRGPRSSRVASTRWYKEQVLLEQALRPGRQADHHPAPRRRDHRPLRPGRTSAARWPSPPPAGRGSCSSCPARRSPATPATASTAASSRGIAREIVEVRADLGVDDRRRGRRRQHLAGHDRRRRRHGPRPGRLHGHARHGDQRPRPPGHPRAARSAHPGAVGHPHGPGRRALHPAAGDPAPREGPGRHLRRRHRQPVLHHRHHRRAAGGRDRGRGAAARAPTRASTASTPTTPAPTPRPPSSTRSPTSTCSTGACGRWTPPPSRSAWTTTCRS